MTEATPDPRIDRLYRLLPMVYRMRDADQGYQLQGLLRVMAEQVNAVEDGISQQYDNWFIETAADWVVPYIGDLVGFRPVAGGGASGSADRASGRLRDRWLVAAPRGGQHGPLPPAQGHARRARRACRRRRRMAGARGRVLPPARVEPEHQPPAPSPRASRRSARHGGARPASTGRSTGWRTASTCGGSTRTALSGGQTSRQSASSCGG